jgi:uncharacterized delta-60 repeat protein/uncharacterized repeat protein (TIGR01451 family)
VSYVIDTLPGDITHTILTDNHFATAAGSDYALPWNGSVNPLTGSSNDWDFFLPYNDSFGYPSTNIQNLKLLVQNNGLWGTLTFPDGSIGPEPINIPINNNGATEFDSDLFIRIFQGPGDSNPGSTPPCFLGNICQATLSINFSPDQGQQPAGAVDVTFNPDDATNSYPPLNLLPGANAPVNAVVVQPNGQAVIGGAFTAYNTTPDYCVARLETTGELDFSFSQNLGSGANGTVRAVALDSLGRIYIGGDFTAINGINANHIARLNATGSLDTSFVTGSGFNYSGTVLALAIDAGGNIVVGGSFSSFNTTNVNNIVRLLPSGGLDPSFLPNTDSAPGLGTDQQVRAVALDGLGNIILGGDFLSVNGTSWSHVGRLLPSGAVDTSFNPGFGADNSVYSLAIEPNNAIIIGGSFQNYNLVVRGSVARLLPSGALDTSFDPGVGANDIIYSVILQADGNIVVGGQFTTFNTVRRVGMARLLPTGWLDTYFMDTAYNQFAGLINHFFNPYAVDPNDGAGEYNQRNFVSAMAIDNTTNIIIGGSFVRVGGGFTRNDIRYRHNLARIVGPSNSGPEPWGLGNAPGNITMTINPYTVDDTAGSLYVGLQRVNGSLGPAAVTLGTNTVPGGATSADFGLAKGFSEYHDVWDIWRIGINGGGNEYGWRSSDGYWGLNYSIQPPAVSDGGISALGLSIKNDKAIPPGVNLSAELSLLNLNAYGLLTLGGETVPTLPAPGQYSSGLEIINDNYPAGLVGFAVTNYTTLDTNGNLTITITRTNGFTGNATVWWTTANGTAISPADYQAAFNTVTFSSGQTTASFTVHVYGKSTLQPTKYFSILITNVSGANLDTNVPPLVYSNTVVQILDANFLPGHLAFSSPSYSALKGSAAPVTVERVGGAQGVLNVSIGTSDITASNGINYVGFTNLLTFPNESSAPQTVFIPTLQDNVVEGAKTVNVSLFNAAIQGVGNVISNSEVLAAPSNAVLTIQDVDSYGTFNFSASNYNVLQSAGQALITVLRTSGTEGYTTVSYATYNDTNAQAPYQPAIGGTNYGITTGSLNFTPGVSSLSFSVPIYYTPNETTTANRIVNLVLAGGSPLAINSQFPRVATLTILDNQLVISSAGSVDLTTASGQGFNDYVVSLALQPAGGSILAGGNFTAFNGYPFDYIGRLNADGSFDTSFLFNMAGANGTVQQVLSQAPLATQTNGNIMVVGNFSTVDQVNRAGIARLNIDGSLDSSFNPGAGADGPVNAIAQQFLPAATTNQPNLSYYVIAGGFANFDGYPSAGVTRLTTTGALDPNFNPGAGVSGSNAVVRVLAIDPNNRILLGGDFVFFNNQAHHHLVRLNVDGSVDSSFLAFDGIASDLNGAVRAIQVQPDGRILIGGSFTNVSGSNFNYFARLNDDGSIDPTFNVGAGCDNTVLAIALDSQNNIYLGGEFSHASAVTRNGITRLNPDGTVDPTINFGFGANGFVDAIVLQNNGEIDVAGGFTTFDNNPENNFVRLYGGANSGDGSLQFSQPVYGVMENGTNATITVQRLGGEGTPAQPTVTVVFSTSDGTALNGSNYIGSTNTLTFPLGETFQNIVIPILDGTVVGGNMSVNLNLTNSTYAGIGPQVNSVLIITNVNTALAFSAESYRQSADAPSGSAAIPIVRQGNPNSTVAVTVYTGTNGTAMPGVNYIPASKNLVFFPGTLTNYLLVPLLNSPTTFNDTTVDLEMDAPSNAVVGAPSSATLTIGAVINAPGTLEFSQTNYVFSEGAGSAAITIIRTNGTQGSVAVNLSTSNLTAVAGVNYLGVNTNVVFGDGEVSQTIEIPIIQLANATPNTTVLLTLSNPQGGALIGGLAQETLTIVNDIPSFSFGQANYLVNEGAGSATLTILLQAGSTNASSSVGYATYSPTNANETNGLAVPNVDYVPASGTVTFAPGQTIQTIPITIIQGTTVNSLETFQVILTNASPGVQLGSPSVTTVGIVSDVTGFALATNAYYVGENGGSLLVQVNRLNPNTGAASVQFSTSDGTAVQGVDYGSTNGVLQFVNGQSASSFIVPILNPNVVESNKTFNLALSRPSAGYIVSPSNSVVTITNVYTGVSFGSASFTVSECAVAATIPVVLTGLTNNAVSVSFATHDGSGVSGVNYFPNSGTLTFQPGQTVQTFTVTNINNHIIGPDHTVNLSLSDASGAQLLNPSAATLTIQECNGAYIVKSGTAFLNGTIQPDTGVVYSNDTVTIAFGLRDVAGGGTANLVATLLQTNGITNASAPQTYGALVEHGPTVSRPFTFTTIGTNGQNLSAVLALQDGTASLGEVVFGFTLGGFVNSFTNPATIIILDSTNPPTRASNSIAPGFGYPSTIDVSGVSAGVVTKVTVTLSDFGHQFPHDVDALIEAPGGQNSILFSKCGLAGSQSSVNDLTMTFDQDATAFVPLYTPMTSGTYRPTSNPTNVMGQLPPVLLGELGVPEAPKAPYTTNLSALIGSPPNGTWALWVVDTVTLDSGYISNGWILNLSSGQQVESDSDLEVAVSSAPAVATLSNTLTYSITVTNYGPSIATNVTVTDPIPNGALYETNANSCDCATLTNGELTFTVPTLAVGAGAAFDVEIMPTNLLTMINVVTALANQPNPNSNNIVTTVNPVSPPSADVGVGITEAPNPVVMGSDVTFVITVTNGGPSTAAAVTAVDLLPPGFVPLTITPSIGTASNLNGTITWNIGDMSASPSAAGPTLTIVAQAAVAGIGLDSVTVSSPVFDPYKLNNYAAVKIDVGTVMLTLNSVGGTYTLTWPAGTGFVLQGAVNLPPLGTWVSITNPPPPVVNGQYVYTLPGNNGYHFFRLMSSP